MFAISNQQSSELVVPAGWWGWQQTISFPPSLALAQLALTWIVTPEDTLPWTRPSLAAFTHIPTEAGDEETVELPPSAAGTSIVGVVERMTSVTWACDGAAVDYKARLDILLRRRVATPQAPLALDELDPGVLAPGIASLLYDEQTGAIRFVHEEISVAGVAAPDPSLIDRRVLAFAQSRKQDVSESALLRVLGPDLRRPRPVRVDPLTRTLIDVAF